MVRLTYFVLFWSLSVWALPAFLHAQTSELNRLVHPETAERLGLSDAQRATLQQLLQERTELEAAASTPERTASLKASEDKILGVLTDEQRTMFAGDASGKLKFQFRDMAWDGVLDWFARQENLTLVMDRTPPGTFTYSDHRQYTSAEAIDLLNSVLLTRGFTMIRREKMLIVIELSDSIPLELIPRITLEQLPTRGRFELVSILFPLGTRPIDEVVKEVTPYLGKYGRAIPLAQSRQLLVIENAGKMQTINVLIATVPEPKPPAVKPDPPAPPQPVFAAYSIAGLDPDATLKSIKTLISSEQITMDAKTRILSAFVIPSQQSAIEKALERMVNEAQTALPQVSKAFPVNGSDPVALASQIKALAPQATVAGEKGATQVLVSAPEADMKRITDAMQSMGITATASDKSLRSFPLERKPTDAWLAMVKAIVPQASVWLDAEKKRLSVLANETDMQLVTKLVPELLTALPPEQYRSLKIYSVTDEQKQRYTTLAPTLTDLAGMKVIEASKPGELMIWGSSEEHQLLGQILSQLGTNDSNTESELRRYDLGKAEMAQLTLLKPEIDKRIAPMQLVLDAAGGGIWAWGTAKQHQILQTALLPLRKPGPLLKTYNVSEEQKRRFTTLSPTLTDLVSLKIIDASLPGQMLLWGTNEEHELVGKLFEQLANGDGLAPNQLRRYEVPKASLPQLTLLKPEIDKQIAPMQITIDAATGVVWGWGAEAQHRKLAEALTPFQQPMSAVKQEVVVAYPLRHADPVTLKPVLAEIHKDVNVVADAKRKMLLVTGNLEQQTRIQSAITQLDQPAAVPVQEEMHAYDLKNLQAAGILPTLQVMWPDMKFTVDTVSNRIVATGNANDQQALQGILERLNEANPGQEMEVKTYAIPFGDVSTINTVLLQLAPKSVSSPDILNRTVTMWATTEQHERVRQAIDQLIQTAQGRQELSSYEVPPERAAAIKLNLATLFPTASVAVEATTGKLIVLATKEQQERIAEVISKSAEPKPERDERSPARYEVPLSLRSAFPNMLMQTYPAATLVTPPTDLVSPLVVLATQAEHAKIEIMVEELKAQVEAASSLTAGNELRIFALDIAVTDALSVMNALKAALPTDVLVQSNATTNSVIVAGNLEQLDRAKELVQSLQSQSSAQMKSTRVYPLRYADATAAARVLTASLPRSIVVGDIATKSLAVTGTASEHDRAAEFVKSFDVATSSDRETVVYRVGLTNATTLASAIQLMLPQASVQADAVSGALIVTANANDHERVKTVVAQLDRRGDSPMVTRSYALRHAEPTAASRALATSFPKAVFSPDSANGGMFVTATEEEHTEINALMESLNASSGKRPVLQSFPLQHTSATIVGTALQKALLRSPTAAVSFDDASATIFVVGNADDLAMAKQLIETLDSADSERQQRNLKLFSLSGTDGLSAVAVIKALFENEKPTIDVRYDSSKGQLVVLGSSKQLEAVEKALEEFTPPDRQLEIVALKVNEPSAVRSAIQTLFTDVSFAEAPSVNVDEARQQLLIRATSEQWVKIRKLLLQMGETESVAAPSTERVRTMAAPADAERVLERIRKVWPSLRSNRLEVFEPEAMPEGEAEKARGPHQPPNEASIPPVILLPGEKRWTIASDDPEALAELERLLAANGIQSASPVIASGNYSLYLLEHAGATNLATILNEVLSRGGTTSATSILGRVKITADPRINALIVYGTKSERMVVEQLLGVLDSDSINDSLRSLLPQVIAIENTNAKRVYDSVREIYKSQLSADGGRRPMPIPEGVSLEVANLLQQINASAAGPLLTVALDAMTNSLLVRAPPELVSEVADFIQLMDRQASERMTTRIDVIPLQHSNAARIRKALDILVPTK